MFRKNDVMSIFGEERAVDGTGHQGGVAKNFLFIWTSLLDVPS